MDLQTTTEDVRERYGWAAGDRVEVHIGDRMRWWSTRVAEALEGKRGIVEEVLPRYEIPCVGTGIGEAIPAFRVVLDEEVRIDDGRSFSAFHFRADELRAEELPARGRADYAERVERRRDRLENGAAKASAEAEGRFKRMHAMAGIIQGEPVKIGHHSERRHRRDLARMDRDLGKGVEAHRRSEALASAAEAVGTGGISSDDPEAVTKLRAELAELEARREHMKAGNAAWRKATPEARVAIAEQYGVSLGRLRAMASYGDGPYMGRVLFPSLTNLGANIRRVTARIAELSKGPPAFESIDGGWYQIEARTDLNRIAITADRRLPKETYLSLKSDGWRWSPKESAFLFHLNANGIMRAGWAHERLSKLEIETPVRERPALPVAPHDALGKNEIELTECEGWSVGDLVGATETLAIEWRLIGIADDSAWIPMRRAGGPIERIVKHSEGLWVSILVRLGDGGEWWAFPGDLVAVAS